MGLNRNLGQLTEVLTESNGNVLLNPNNTVGGTNVYIGQTMATNDNWKIYGNTIASDQGEMVFELGDNADPISSAGQRFKFYYNPIGGGGTAKSPLILDYNDAIFSTNASFTGNVGIGVTVPKEKFEVVGLTGNIRIYGRSGIAQNQITSNVYYNGSSWVRDTSAGAVAISLDSNGGSLGFFTTSATSGFPNERMRIFSNGNVFIGPTPTDNGSRLQIDGGATFVGTTTLSYPDQGGARFKIVNSAGATPSGYGLIAGIAGISQDGFSIYDYTNSATRLTIAPGGEVLIGTTSYSGGDGLTVKPVHGASYAQISIIGNNASGSNANLYFEAPGSNGCGMFLDRNANILKVWSGTTTNGVGLTQFSTSWSSYSDIRLKTDLIPIEDALVKIKDMRAVTGRYKTDPENMSRSFLIAQDILEVFPEAVYKAEDEIGTLSLSYTEMVPLLLKAIQEQQQTIEQLTNRIINLENK